MGGGGGGASAARAPGALQKEEGGGNGRGGAAGTAHLQQLLSVWYDRQAPMLFVGVAGTAVSTTNSCRTVCMMSAKWAQ